jgi:hypothetical protein
VPLPARARACSPRSCRRGRTDGRRRGAPPRAVRCWPRLRLEATASNATRCKRSARRAQRLTVSVTSSLSLSAHCESWLMSLAFDAVTSARRGTAAAAAQQPAGNV